MIDTRGKPYEIGVVDSTGIPAFEKTAIAAVEKALFVPATLGNTPVDSRMRIAISRSTTTRAGGERSKSNSPR